MQCVDCKFVEAQGKEGEGRFFCHKKKQEVFPYNYCKMSKKFKDEQRAIDIYIDNYKDKTLNEIVELIDRKSIDKAKLNYLITKNFLPRILWEEN